MERISCVLELEKDDFYYNIYDKLKELYTERVCNEPDYRDKFDELSDFINEYLDFVKDDSNENFKKYNVHHRDYPNRRENCVKCRLCILKKEVFGIEKDTCVFISEINLSVIHIFYLKEDCKNIDLAKEVWTNELNYGDFKGKHTYIYKWDEETYTDKETFIWDWNSFEIKDKDKYILKCFNCDSYTQIIAQTKFVMKEYLK
jgi:hypothetical protein